MQTSSSSSHMASHESCKRITQEEKLDHCPRRVSQVAKEDTATDFAINQEALSKLVEANNTMSLNDEYGGINGIASALQTNLDSGINGDAKDLCRRHESFGSNLNLEPKRDSCSLSYKGLFRLCLDSFKDTTIILLLCCGLLSFVIGIKRNGPQEGFLDGAIIFSAMSVVIGVGVISQYCKSIIMIKKSLRDGKNNVVEVRRRGRILDIPISEVVVGDIVCLKSGNQVPADGLFIHGDSSFTLDDDVVVVINIDYQERKNYFNYPSLYAGSNVAGGACRMLVTAVGRNTKRSKLMMKLATSYDGQSEEQTLLQLSLVENNTSSRLEKVLLSLSLFLLTVQLVRCFAWESSQRGESRESDHKGVKNTVEEIMNKVTRSFTKKQLLVTKENGLVGMLCILIFALRDGLPLGVFVILLYASKKMMSSYQRSIVIRKLPKCATLGLVTTICTDITGDLALRHMNMVDLWVGHERIHKVKNAVVADHHVLNTLREGVCMNAFGPAQDGLLCWAQKFLHADTEELNRTCTINLSHESFDDLKKTNQTGISLTRKGEMDRVMHVHWKGDPEIIVSMCSHYYDVNGTMKALDQHKRDLFKKIVESIESNHGIQYYFAFAYKEQKKDIDGGDDDDDDDDEPLQLLEEEEKEEAKTLKPREDGLTLLAIVALKNPYDDEDHVEVREAIEANHEQGIKMKLMVNEDINTAKFIAINSGIMKVGEDTIGAVIEASEFRNSSEEERMSMVENIRVMSNASLLDKLLFLKCLRQRGEVVAVTGKCTRDSPLMREADVGLLLSGEIESAKRSSDFVIISDQKIATVFALLNFGRSICFNLRKFFQVQLTLNVTTFSFNFINVLLGTSDNQVALTTFQILWVNLIMDVFAALALAALVVELKPPTTSDHTQQITKNSTMWRNVLVQSMYQVTVLLVLNIKGKAVLQVDETSLKVIIFNCYLLSQVCVLINARVLDEHKTKHALEGIKHYKKDLCFLAMVAAIVILQVCFVETAAVVNKDHRERLDLKHWFICIAISAVSLPIGWVAKTICLI